MPKQKDHAGKEPEFVERANEDFYFAVKDRELIQDMKDELHRKKAAEEQILNCPNCPGTLESYKYMEFNLHRCNQCQGIWLRSGELERVVTSATRGPLGAFFDRCFSR